MSNLITGDWDTYKSSCTVVFDNPNPNFPYSGPVALCGICSALILMNDTMLGSHWRWHNEHWQNHAMFAPHAHSPVNGLVVGLPDNPAWDKTFG
jgi:hypothetical protein